MNSPHKRQSLVLRGTLVVFLLTVAAVCLPLLLLTWLPPLWAAAVALVILLPAAWLAARAQWEPMLSVFRALSGTVASYRDGDYSFGLRWDRHDELRDLVDAHNELGEVLRAQRLNLVQRELLLDTMVQNTPVAMLLVSDGGPVIFANLAARQMLNQGRKIEGMSLQQVLGQAQPASCAKPSRAAATACSPSAEKRRKRCTTWHGAPST
jgi:PAS domain-containing protein